MAATTSAPKPESQAGGSKERSAWLDVDWREHQRWMMVDGSPVNVIDIGSGPPLLFIHGLSGCWQNWLENIPRFARSHRVIAMDLPGFGSSEMPRERISIAGYARCVDQICDALDISAAAVVGNSMGGFIAAELAISFPQRVERLVLVSAAGITAENIRREPVIVGGRLLEIMAGWALTRQDRLVRRPGLRRLALSLVVHRPDLLSAPLASELIRGSGKPGFLQALEANIGYPIRERLPQIACPTLIVWGAKDHIIPVRDADVFERMIPNSRKLIYEHTGHVAMLECPERFNDDLQAFFDQLPTSA